MRKVYFSFITKNKMSRGYLYYHADGPVADLEDVAVYTVKDYVNEHPKYIIDDDLIENLYQKTLDEIDLPLLKYVIKKELERYLEESK